MKKLFKRSKEREDKDKILILEHEKSFSDLLKNYGLWFFSVLFLEIAFIIIMSTPIEFGNILNILLYSIILSAFLALISNIFKPKVNTIITAVILLVFGVLFSIQCVFFSIFKIYFSLTNLGLGDQVTSYLDKAFSATLSNLPNIVIFMLPFILYLIFHKKVNFKRNNYLDYVTLPLIIVLFIPIFYFNVMTTKGETNGTYELYFNVNEVSLNINKLGVLNSYTIDLYRLVFGFVPKDIEFIDADDIEPKKKETPPPSQDDTPKDENDTPKDENGNPVDENGNPIEENTPKEVEPEKVYEPNTRDLKLDKPTSNSSIQKINKYVKSDSGTLKNEYSGKFRRYNLVYITAESFSEIGISKELTPTLYKLTHSGFVFDNYYTPNALSTIGGEFQSLTGLYPDSSILTKWRSGENYFPYGLATIFRKYGYNTYAYHNNSYGFQDRHKYIKSQGFNNYLACYNGLEKRINCKIWPSSDDEMIKETVKDYINSDKPFLAYYMTVSGHFAYTFEDNMMASRNKDKVKNLNVTNAAKAYVATQIELDKALERLIKELKKAGKLDNTVFVLLADHYPYELDIKSINNLSSYKRDEIVEVNHNALILWNSQMEETHITKACMSSDVLPTVLNLFGIKYDSRLFTGRDILSDSLGIAIMRNHSWVTELGTYFSSTGKFVKNKNSDQEVPKDYVKKINTLVNNRLNIAKLIVETDYYRYLFK